MQVLGVHGELVILAENQAFFALHRMTILPNLPRHGESIRRFRPHPVYDCQTAQTRRRKGCASRKLEHINCTGLFSFEKYIRLDVK